MAKTRMSSVEEINAAETEKMEAADRLLHSAALEERDLTSSEFNFVRRELSLEPKDVRSELKRHQRILKLKGIAGSSQDRQQLANHAVASRERLETDGPRLRQEIEQRQRELRSMESDASHSQRRCEEAEKAVLQLRELAPSWVIERYRIAVKEAKQTVGRQLHDTEREIALDESDCKLEALNQRDVQAMKNRGDGFVVFRQLPSGSASFQVTDKWLRRLEQQAEQLPSLKEREAKLRDEFDSLMSNAEKLLDCYC